MSDEQDATRALFQPTVGATLGRYKILSKLGAGGMGVVYLAEETTLARTVALKFLPTSLAVDPEFRARFEREAKAVASLHHPNIVHIYAVDEHRDHPFIAMEYVDGPALRTVLADGRLALPKAADYAEALAGALGEAHRSGVVHRDVKPGNVVVDSAGRPKLLDFGLAVLGRGEAITKTGTTLGTIGYMAPEQARGETADPRSDLFSLVGVVFEMATGGERFRAGWVAAALGRVVLRSLGRVGRFAWEIAGGLERIVG
jgi:serine/threonine protein kinase